MNSDQAFTAIVLNVGGLSAQHLPTYGNNWIDTPNINRLANQSEIFEFAFADHVSCQPARNLLTGMKQNAPLERINQFGQAGIKTTLISDCLESIHPDSVETFDDIFELSRTEPTRLAESIEDTVLANSFAQIVSGLDPLLANEPGVVWIELDGMQSFWDAPYAVRESFVEEDDPDPPYFFQAPNFQISESDDVDPDMLLGIQQSFAAQLTVFDTCLGVLLDHLDIEQQQSMLFALTSHQGYPLGEHFVVGQDQPILFGESIHVPWVLFQSDMARTAFRHQRLCYSCDIVEQLIDRVWNARTSSSKSAELLGSGIDRKAILCEAIDGWALRTPAWLAIHHQDRSRLYVKPDDRWEVNDVSSRRKDVIESLIELEASLQNHLANDSTEPEIPPELTKTWGR